MKKILFLAVVLAMAAGAGIAFSASSGVSGPAVWGGGHYLFPGTAQGRDFSVDVKPGAGEFVYGRVDIGSALGALPVTCVDVSGNRAVIAGYTTQGDYAGTPYLWYAIDNGPPRADQTFDQASAVFVALTPEELSAMPAGFPHVCPAADDPPSYVVFSDVIAGDLVVRAAGSR